MRDIALALLGIVFLITNISNITMAKQIGELEENLMDIDQRLTILEQSLNETDKAVVKALQGSNEALYELKLMELNGKQ